MKKILISLFAGISLTLMLLFSSCGGKQSSASDVVKAGLEYMKSGDIESYVKLIDVGNETDPEQIEAGRKLLSGLISMGIAEVNKQHQGIKDFEIISEEVGEEGTAKVTFKIKYNDGTEDEQTGNCIKGKDGNWYLKM